ncbi:N-acetyltransferase [Lysobacter sp. S4-A87]|uniref:GNAT family N-acetyltransferase n=1 Tax=Lysobacter sp. S4-A87 TaxID=2925843 RepID=UPI001F53BCA0|nr:N-acetyltransferase [Lysobacter sp. S4-A87]UNK51017.1 N-acetyltransferase [Lysobacter sp. S4-A87]
MWIRTETQADHTAISNLIATAFADQQGAGRTEQRIVDALRADGALSLSLVADIDGRIAGHVAFSPVRVGDGTERWYGLGPVSVAPRDQRNGVGSALIRAGLSELAERGALGCVVLGEPGYYQRFGFRQVPGLRFGDVPAEYFQALAFGDRSATGEVTYHASFTAQ